MSERNGLGWMVLLSSQWGSEPTSDTVAWLWLDFGTHSRELRLESQPGIVWEAGFTATCSMFSGERALLRKCPVTQKET